MAHKPDANLNLLNALPDEEFFDREKDIEDLYHLAIEVKEGLTASLFLYGKRGVGKTETLKKLYRRLYWNQTEVIPFYYSLADDSLSAIEFARDYLIEFIKQHVGFKTRDNLLIAGETLSLSKLESLLRNLDDLWLIELVENYKEYLSSRDFPNLIKNSLTAPHQTATLKNTCCFVIIDDFQKIGDIYADGNKLNILSLFQEVISSRRAPHLITGSSLSILDILNKEPFLGNLDFIELKGLFEEAAIQMFEGLSHRYKVRIGEERALKTAIVDQLGRIPFYIRSIIKRAKYKRSALDTDENFYNTYLQELLEGSIHFYWSSVLSRFFRNPPERKRAIEIILYCQGAEGLHFERVSKRFFKDDPEAERSLDLLYRAGLIDIEGDLIRGVQDPVLQDYIRCRDNIELRGLSLVQVRQGFITERQKEIKRNKTDEKGYTLDLTIPIASDMELVATRVLEQLASVGNMDEDSLGQIRMALVEACLNAFEYSDGPDKKINIRFILEGDRLTINILNEGKGFDPSILNEPKIEEKISSRYKRGWGIKLMKSLMDEVSFENVTEGTLLTMVKKLKQTGAKENERAIGND